MLIKMVPVALGLALSACPFGTEDDVHGGYAVVEGVVTLRDGTPMQAAVRVECGFFALTELQEGGSETASDAQGRYSWMVEEHAHVERPVNGAFALPCLASAGGQFPWASRRVDVGFHLDRDRAPVTRIDLVEGELVTEWQPQP
jgi:hypothetical protein